MSVQACKDLLSSLPKLKVLVLGDLMLDVYDFCHSESSRPSPERPGRFVYTAASSMRTLGGAGNVAANLAALEVPTVLISVCGMDGQYVTLRDLADTMGLHHFLIREEGRPTTTKTRLYIDDEYMLRRDDEAVHPLRSDTVEVVLREFRRELKGTDAVILSDYAKGFFSEELSQALIQLCREADVPVIVDFKPKNIDFFKGATLIAPNRNEATALLPGFDVSDALPQHLRALYDMLGCENVAVTLSEHGISGFDGQRYEHVAGYSVRCVDSVGCGDTVRAALALGVAGDLSFTETLAFANAAAAVVVQQLGTAAVTRTDLLQFISSLPDERTLDLVNPSF